MSYRQSWTESLLPRKRAPDTIHSTPVDRYAGPYPVSLPSEPMKQQRKPNIYQQQATRLIGPISPACDRYVQYLLIGANSSVLKRHRQGLQPWGCRLSTYHSLTFPISCLHFSPRVSPGLRLSNIPSIKPELSLANLWPPRGLSTTRPPTAPYIYA
jgi:hypothetical protein